MPMNNHPINQLHALFFDRLESEERRRVEAHVATCVSCTERLERFTNAVNEMPKEAPRPELRDRLFQSVEHLERFTPFAKRLGELIAVPTRDARRALHGFFDVGSWPLSPLPGMRALPLSPGPSHAHLRAILACFQPTSMVPRHRHFGHEAILVFQGAFQSSDGRVIRVGDELHSEPGSAHWIPRFVEDIECLCAIINTDRFEYEDQPSEGDVS